MPLVDTHVHLNFDTFAGDLDDLAQAWRKAGVVRMVHSCVEPREFAAMQAIANRFPEVFLAVGLHPLDVGQWTTETAGEIEAIAASEQRVVAIGETGLDFLRLTMSTCKSRHFGHRWPLPIGDGFRSLFIAEMLPKRQRL